MREFETNLVDISTGLRPFRTTGSGLLECHNLMARGEEGLWPYEPVSQIVPTTPASGQWTVEWPWPQVHVGSTRLIGLAVADANDCAAGIPPYDGQVVLYEIDPSDWTIDYIWTVGSASIIQQSDITDFGPFYVVSAFGYNGITPTHYCFNRIYNASKPNSQIEFPGSNYPYFITSCNFNGQLVVGGISSSHAPWSSLDLSFVCWSAIGSFELDPQENVTAGFMPLSGEVRKVMKLGKQVVAFTTVGIHALIPFDTLPSGFGEKNLSLPGIRNGWHVGGSEALVIWIDYNNDLWIMDQGMTSKKLGYREWMEKLDSSKIKISYLKNKKIFFISDGVICYVLVEGGLSTCHQRITSVGIVNNEVIGFFDDTNSVEWRLETGEMDFSQRSLKTIQNIEVHGADEQMSARVKFRSKIGASYGETSWRGLNPLGSLYLPISGTDFKIGLRGIDYRELERTLSSIKLRVKQTDKRTIRGLYNVDKNSSRSNSI